jgi:aspartate oxidase
MHEFEDDYAAQDARSDGNYVLTRDRATYAITKEVEMGRGSPAGGAYLSFKHVPDADLRRSFGPVIDKLAANGIDLTQQLIEVAPIAHYHMGGVRVDESMQTGVPGLYACGEAVGGANGANRLSGNAITEAFVFGARAGQCAAKTALQAGAHWSDEAAAPALDMLRASDTRETPNLAVAVTDLQALMADKVGPFRTEEKLAEAIVEIDRMASELGTAPPSSGQSFDPLLIDWLDLRNMLQVAKAVAVPALARTESRGAHQRDDHPGLDEAWTLNQTVTLSGGVIALSQGANMSKKASA